MIFAPATVECRRSGGLTSHKKVLVASWMILERLFEAVRGKARGNGRAG